MTNQIKYLLIPLTLSVLAGCGEPEANSEEKTLEEQCEAYYSGQMAENFEFGVENGRFTQEEADRWLKLAAERMERDCKGK